MSGATDATAGSATMPVTDALGAVGAAMKQLALAMQELAAVMWHGATEAGQVLVQQPASLITGIAIGLLVAALVWLTIGLVRRRSAATPQHTARSDAATPLDAKDDLKSLPLAEVEKRLSASSDGLTSAEATKRLAQYGPNEIEDKKANALLTFLRYFWGPIPWMIEVAVVLSGVVRHWPDFFIILLLLVANATIGFWEQRQAGNAIDALKARLATKARVKRDGKWITPPARDVVPGDVIRLRLGDIVPADARLLDGDEISVDQSALTGESLPASKKSGEAVFSGSIVRRGEIGALVYATGGKTYFGQTAELVQ
jgi:H+-transporting ATPase